MPKKVKTNKNTKSKEIVKPLTKEEVKEQLKTLATYEAHPETAYEKIWKTIAVIRSWGKDEEWFKYLKEHLLDLDTFNFHHTNLANTVSWSMTTSVVELANNLIEEYDCNTTLEKSLCEVIANSYWKIMSISKRLNSNLDFEYFWTERNQFIWILSKELDRANRSYLTSLNNLLEIKRPVMSINVKTKNAYFWQNQQFNNNETKDENIKD